MLNEGQSRQWYWRLDDESHDSTAELFVKNKSD
jgi:hypothetical protein